MKMYVIFGRYYGTQAEARSAAKENGVKFAPEQDTVEVPTDKEGLIAYLNRLASQIPHELNAHDEFTTVVERQDPPVEAPRGWSVAETSLGFDDAFEQMPLARQLHFAAIACENAREQLGRETRPPLAPQGYAGSQPRMEGRIKANVELAGDDDLLS